jgi:hypothetical protein
MTQKIEKFEIGDVVRIISDLFEGQYGIINSTFSANGISAYKIARTVFRIKIENKFIHSCWSNQIEKIVPKLLKGQSFRFHGIKAYVIDVSFDFDKKQYKYLVNYYGTEVSLYESEIPTQNEKIQLEDKVRKIHIELKDIETTTRFLDYLFAMPDGRGVTIKILDDREDISEKNSKKLEDIKSILSR